MIIIPVKEGESIDTPLKRFKRKFDKTRGLKNLRERRYFTKKSEKRSFPIALGASKKQILRYVIFPNSLPEILTGIRVAVGMCWGTLVAAEFLAGTTGIGFVENVAKKYFQYEVIWITIFIMGMLGLLFDVTLRKIIDKTIPWRGKG